MEIIFFNNYVIIFIVCFKNLQNQARNRIDTAAYDDDVFFHMV